MADPKVGPERVERTKDPKARHNFILYCTYRGYAVVNSRCLLYA